jgi:transglutaminase-like putative cysteine protease
MTIAVTPCRPEQIEKSPPWESVRGRLAYDAAPPRPEDLDALRFLFESAHVRIKRELADYAAACFPPGRPVLVGAQALMAKIFRELKFDPEATTVSTPVMEVLQKKRGVCQDFAHLMIACLRALGLAARYVSGYLRDPAAAGQAAPGRGRRLARLGFGLRPPDSATAGSISIRPTTCCRIPNTSPSPLAAISATSRRCAASSSAAGGPSPRSR